MPSITISDKELKDLIARRTKGMLGLADYITKCDTSARILARPLLGELLAQSMQMEELLDAYDARNNCQWCAFRSLTATLKLFSDVSYELLHIQHSVPAYRLLPVEHDFVKATQHALDFTAEIIRQASGKILTRAEQLELTIPTESLRSEVFDENLPQGRLPHDCGMRRTGTIAETVSMLATAFLNLAAESRHVHGARNIQPDDYASYVLDTISEEGLRSMELRFHNLQSLYDTYVSGTEAESLDADLPVLRGHISVVFHLLKTATAFAHYYERHVDCPVCETRARQIPFVNSETLLAVLIEYSICNISRYIKCAERLCRAMLNRYTEVGQVEVPVPGYRGFHVRPSTLISKLVLHYGSEVKMELKGDSYDASSPLELFRANEKINAEKRKWLAKEIDRLKLVQEEKDHEKLIDIVRGTVLTMAEQGKLILYEQPLELPDISAHKEGTLLEQVVDIVGRLLATGKIDIQSDLKVKFIGDKRVIQDIKLLAESGYGEDKFGNNIVLPEKLAYLRR